MTGSATEAPPLEGRIDGRALLQAPVAIRVFDLAAPLADIRLSEDSDSSKYRSLLAVARMAGYPPVLGTFSVGFDGHVERDRLAAGLRRSLEAEMRDRVRRGPHQAGWRTRAPSRGNRITARSPRVSVVVPTCANPLALERCVRSILRCDYDNFEVIVVENRPREANTGELLAECFGPAAPIRYVEEPRRGASRARNAGLAQADGELVAFADDDIVVDPAWLRTSVEAMHRADDVVCVTGLILPLELESESQLLMEQFAGFGKGVRPTVFRLRDAAREDPLLPYTPGAVGSGASMLMRTEIARELGGFDPALGPATPTTGGEDLDLFVRLLRAGHAVVYEPGAVVWHEHPDGPDRLRRQVRRYGVGLGALLAKQLLAGPNRREFLRAVPAGVRYLRDPSSRKNAGKPETYPRRLKWLELSGLAVGPLAYVLSVVLAILGRSTEADRARTTAALPRLLEPTAEATVLCALIASAAAPLAVALGLPVAIRAPAVIAFLLLAPGAAILRVVRARAGLGLTVGLSIGTVAVIAQAMLWSGAFAPRPFLYATVAATLLTLTGPIDWQELGRRARSVTRAARAAARARAVWLHVATVIAALALWVVSLSGTDLRQMAGLGLLDALPATYFLSFALLLGGFVVAAADQRRDPRLIGVYVMALIVVLHLTTVLLYDEPRYSWVYKHLGVINLIASTGHAQRDVDIYNNWPAFFGANAWMSRLSGLGPIAYAAWAQPFFNVLDVLLIRFALRGVTREERHLWTAGGLFVLGNWVGQDYLSPQAFAFALSLVVIGLCLRCGRRPRPSERPPLGGRSAVAIGAICFLAIVTSHQLSPVLLIVTVAALALIARRVPLWVPVAMAAVEVWWVALAWSFLTSHFKLLQFGGGAGGATRVVHDALPGAALGFYAPAAVMALITALALYGWIGRLRSGRREIVAVCCVVAPAVAVAFQSYDGEGIFRAFLFALPWLAYLAAVGCVSLGARASRLGLARFALAASAIGTCLLLATFGQELGNRISSDDVAAQTWYEGHVPAGSVAIELGASSPSRLTARYPLVHLSDPASLLENAAFIGRPLGPADLGPLEALSRAQGNHPVYVILAQDQADYGRLNGLLPHDSSAAELTAALERSGAFQLTFARPTAWVLRYRR